MNNNPEKRLIALAIQCGAESFGYGVIFKRGADLIRFYEVAREEGRKRQENKQKPEVRN